MCPVWIPFSMEEEGERVPWEGVEGKRGKTEKICEVCGAPSLGHNFGAVSCESCKAFFRRNAFRLQVVKHFKVMPDLQNRSSLVPSKTSVGLTVLQEGDMNELLQQSLTAALEQVLPEVPS